MPIQLKKASDLKGQITQVYTKLASRISQVLPGAAVQEIGSTSIPGCLTKGDVDILVEVSATDFEAANTRLRETFEINAGMQDYSLFASFKGVQDGVDFGVQLCCDSSLFGFTEFRRALIQDANLVKQYNDVKKAAAHLDDDEYRSHKNEFIERVLTNTRMGP